MNELPSYQRPTQEKIDQVKLLPVEEKIVFMKEQVDLSKPETTAEAKASFLYWKIELGIGG